MITLVRFIVFFSIQFQTSFSQYNLFHTETSLKKSHLGHDCLYQQLDYFLTTKIGFMPWCVRHETVQNEDFCHGEEITFKQLKINNISIADLFHWNAVIETIDSYEKYLIQPNLVNENEIYCNCSHLFRFGKACQYEIDRDDNIERTFSSFFSHDTDIVGDDEDSITPLTCYIGIQCQTNLLCLDWRQICNGVVDCDYGEDEPAELCHQIESNECDAEKEFRCLIGFCISLSLPVTSLEYCFDRSDSKKTTDKQNREYLLEICSRHPSLECDETKHGWKQFSCNNGQYISYSDLTSQQQDQTCTNNRHLIYLRSLFSTTNEDECWISMICLTGFDYLYSHIDCPSNETIRRNINEFCSNEFYFPRNSIVYSYVFFFYDKTEFISAKPNSICYKKEFCPNKTWTFAKDDLVCFPTDRQIFSWMNFYGYVIHLFSSCYSTEYVNANNLYKCELSQTLISIHRVKNKRKDCFFNEDESEQIDLCSLKINDQFRCFTNTSHCIRQLFVNDKEDDCLDASDEYIEKHEHSCATMFCDSSHPWKKRSQPEIYLFDELCDNIVNTQLFDKDSNETDETDCQHWLYPCHSPYTHCDRRWNCYDGRDEIECHVKSYNDPIRKAFNCQSNEHYCVRLTDNRNNVSVSCLNFNRINDGINDCLGGTDERLINICMKNYPYDHRRRFHCENSSECIQVDQICNGKIDCPFEDDERVCPWLFVRNASKFQCRNIQSSFVGRCIIDTKSDRLCQMKEHLWFCDLEMIKYKPDHSWLISYESYPLITESNQDDNQLIPSVKQTKLYKKILIDDRWLCNFGFRIRSLNQSICLCPLTYFGEYCQYQSEYLIVVLQVRLLYFLEPSTVFRLFVYLINEDNVILSYEQIVYNVILSDDFPHYVYLSLERIKSLSWQQRAKPKSVRIDSYIVNETSVQYISSWMFSVLFPFLPANKLIVELSLVNQSYQMLNCKKICSSHGKCMFYLNSPEKQYCSCEQGWFGEKCQTKISSNSCNQTLCAPHARCLIVNNASQCICPLGKFGKQCYITYNPCATIQCRNNGTCLAVRQENIHTFTCVCTTDYWGFFCESFKSRSNISINTNLTNVSFAPAIVLIFSSIDKNALVQYFQYLLSNATLPITLTITTMMREFTFVQIHYNFSTSVYYLATIRRNKVGSRYLNTTVTSKYRCANVNQLFNQTVFTYSYLKRLKLYHLPCDHNHDLRCFVDEYRVCICSIQHRSSCFLFAHDHSQCNFCMNNGKCLKSNKETENWKFICICPPCKTGNRCQFSLGDYYMTLDTLVGKEVKQVDFKQQSWIVHFTSAILSLFLLVSFIFNTISLIILSKKKLRQVGCDLYLLYLTIFAQLGLILLFLRFIYMIIIQTYVIDNQSFIGITCILLEYSVRLIPSIFDWLTVCISIERAYIINKGVCFTSIIALKVLTLSRWIIGLVLLFNILTTLHRPFHLILVDEISFTGQTQGHPWCVLNFQSNAWNIYEKFINICHLVLPLILNVASIIFLIFKRATYELKSTMRKDKRTRFSTMKEQIVKYKPLIIGTMINVLLEIPRFISTFTLSCIEHAWQRYLYLAGYLLSFVPLSSILFIYIITSPKHHQELQITIKNIFSRKSIQTIA